MYNRLCLGQAAFGQVFCGHGDGTCTVHTHPRLSQAVMWSSTTYAVCGLRRATVRYLHPQHGSLRVLRCHLMKASQLLYTALATQPLTTAVKALPAVKLAAARNPEHGDLQCPETRNLRDPDVGSVMGQPLVDSEDSLSSTARGSIELEALPVQWLPRSSDCCCYESENSYGLAVGGDMHDSAYRHNNRDLQRTAAAAGTSAGGEHAWAIAYRHYKPGMPAAMHARASPLDGAPTAVAPPPLSPSPTLCSAPPAAACVLFCNGLKSSMTSTKVRRSLEVAAAAGCEFVCFDYSGFGASRGPLFEACGLHDWIGDAAAVLTRVVTAPRVVVVGSSIGAWVALRLAQAMAGARWQMTPSTATNKELPPGSPSSGSPATTTSDTTTAGLDGAATSNPIPTRTTRPRDATTPAIASLLLVAPAVDISEVHWSRLTEAEQRHVAVEGGVVRLRSPYNLEGGDAVGAPYFLQGRRHLLHCPAGRSQPPRPGIPYLSALTGNAATFPEHSVHVPFAAPVPSSSLPPQEPQSAASTAAVGAEGDSQREPTGDPSSVACPLAVPVPVVILHGSDDEVVPLEHAEILHGAINAAAAAAGCSDSGAVRNASAGTEDVNTARTVRAPGADGTTVVGAGMQACTALLEVLGGGDHRLSSPEGLDALSRHLEGLVRCAGCPP